jgi:glycerol kinase
LLAGVGSGQWSLEQLKDKRKIDAIFQPRPEVHQKAEKLYRGWTKAVNRSKRWLCDDENLN